MDYEKASVHSKGGPMANVFISHRSIDVVLAERLARDLRRAGHAVEFEPWEKHLGDNMVAQLGSGLRGVCYLLLCYAAYGQDAWVNHTWQSALTRQLQYHEIRLIPILLSGDESPEILADTPHIDLVKDWDEGLKELLWRIR